MSGVTLMIDSPDCPLCPCALSDLTVREREVLALMAEGHSNAAICQITRMAPKTLESHIRNVFRKMLIITDEPGRNPRVTAVLYWLQIRGDVNPSRHLCQAAA